MMFCAVCLCLGILGAACLHRWSSPPRKPAPAIIRSVRQRRP